MLQIFQAFKIHAATSLGLWSHTLHHRHIVILFICYIHLGEICHMDVTLALTMQSQVI